MEYKSMEAVCSPEVLAGLAGTISRRACPNLQYLGQSSLLNGAAPTGFSFDVSRRSDRQDFPLTAHLHNADCLYFVIRR